jgi:hypothetical protein
MALTEFRVYRGGAEDDIGAVHVLCFDGNKQVLVAYVLRTALEDYFQLPEPLTLMQCNLLVDSNLKPINRIIARKYEREERSIDMTFPRVDINLDDMRQCGEKLSAEILTMKEMSDEMTRRSWFSGDR